MEQCLFPKGVLSISCYWFCLLYRILVADIPLFSYMSLLAETVTFFPVAVFDLGYYLCSLMHLLFTVMFLLCPTTLSSPVCSHCSSHLFFPPKFLRIKVTLNCPLYLFTQFAVQCLKYGPSSRMPKSFKCQICCIFFHPIFLGQCVTLWICLPS